MEENKIKILKKCLVAFFALCLAASLLLLFPQGRGFYVKVLEFVKRRPLRQPELWLGRFAVWGKKWPPLFLCLTLFLLFLKEKYFSFFVNSFLEQTKENCKRWWASGVLKKSVVFFAIYVVAISAIIRANYNYIDDLSRISMGYKGWDNFSRYLSNFLSTFINASVYLTDISPFTQLFCAALMAASSVIVLDALCEKGDGSEKSLENTAGGKTKIFVPGIVAALPLSLSPYFLECYSYKFDSPYMAISVFASLFPILFAGADVAYCAYAFLGPLVMCTTYQSSSGIFPLIVIFVFLRKWNRGERADALIKFGIQSVVSYLAALLFFRVFLMKPVDSYVTTGTWSLLKMVPGFLSNLSKYYKLLFSDWNALWLSLTAILFAGYIFVQVRESSRSKALSFFAHALGMAFSLLLPFGIYPALKTPLFFTRAMYGIGALVAFCGVSCVCVKKNYLLKAASLVLSWCFFTFSLTYGNALHQQKEYALFRMTVAACDLNNIPELNNENKKRLALSGNIGLAPVIDSDPRFYRNMLLRLFPSTMFGGPWEWDGRYFWDYLKFPHLKREDKDFSEPLPLKKDTPYHSIYTDGERILIKIK